MQYLEDSSSLVLNSLRADEGKRDLDEQFKSRDVSHHRYFVHPYKRMADEWGPMVMKANYS